MSNTPRPRYVLCPGNVMSKSDGQWHHVGAMELARLYGVNPRECVVSESWRLRGTNEKLERGLIRLTPRYDGDYSLPDHVAAPKEAP